MTLKLYFTGVCIAVFLCAKERGKEGYDYVLWVGDLDAVCEDYFSRPSESQH